MDNGNIVQHYNEANIIALKQNLSDYIERATITK